MLKEHSQHISLSSCAVEDSAIMIISHRDQIAEVTRSLNHADYFWTYYYNIFFLFWQVYDPHTVLELPNVPLESHYYQSFQCQHIYLHKRHVGQKSVFYNKKWLLNISRVYSAQLLNKENLCYECLSCFVPKLLSLQEPRCMQRHTNTYKHSDITMTT